MDLPSKHDAGTENVLAFLDTFFQLESLIIQEMKLVFDSLAILGLWFTKSMKSIVKTSLYLSSTTTIFAAFGMIFI